MLLKSKIGCILLKVFVIVLLFTNFHSFVVACCVRGGKAFFASFYDEKDRIVMREGSHRYEIKKVKVLYRCNVTTRHIMTPPPHLPRSRLCRYFAIIISLGQATNE